MWFILRSDNTIWVGCANSLLYCLSSAPYSPRYITSRYQCPLLGRFVVGNDTYAPCIGWEIGSGDCMMVVDYYNASKGTKIVGLRSLMGDIAPARSG